MLKTYTWPRYAYRRAPEIGQAGVRRVPLVVVGAGPVGLSAAIDAALRGLPVVLLDEDDTVSVGSRGVCYAKRTLEIFDHCLPFDVSRAYDEATAHRDPRIWTAERDVEMWKSLEGG